MFTAKKRTKTLYAVILIIVMLITIGGIINYYARYKSSTKSRTDVFKEVHSQAHKAPTKEAHLLTHKASASEKYAYVTEYLRIYNSAFDEAKKFTIERRLNVPFLYSHDDQVFAKVLKYINSMRGTMFISLKSLSDYNLTAPRLGIVGILEKIYELPVGRINLLKDKNALFLALGIPEEYKKYMLDVINRFFELKWVLYPTEAKFDAFIEWLDTSVWDAFDASIDFSDAVRMLRADPIKKIDRVKNALKKLENNEGEEKENQLEVSAAIREIPFSILEETNNTFEILYSSVSDSWMKYDDFARFIWVINSFCRQIRQTKKVVAVVEDIPMQPLVTYLTRTVKLSKTDAYNVAVVILSIVNLFTPTLKSNIANLTAYFIILRNYRKPILQCKGDYPKMVFYRKCDFSEILKANEHWVKIKQMFLP